MRRAVQDMMRADMIATVQRLTGRTVEALLTSALQDPDVAIAVFLMVPGDRDGAAAPDG